MKATVIEQTIDYVESVNAERAKTPFLTPRATLIPKTPRTEPDYIKTLVAVTPDRSYSDGYYNPFKDVTSEWVAGSVSDDAQTDWEPLYVTTGPLRENGRNALRTIVIQGPDSIINKYNKIWLPPHDIGAITITNITKGPDGDGSDGIVYFKGANGETGTFSLKTEQWSFDNANTTPPPLTFQLPTA